MTDFFRAFLKSSFTVRVKGENPQRFLNAAAAKGVYVSRVSAREGELRLNISREGQKIMEENLPEGLEMEKLSEHGAPKILRPLKKRYVLFFGGALALGAWIFFSAFIWRIEIKADSPLLKKEVEDFLNKNGITAPVLKKKVNQEELKRNAILTIDDLTWLWVDIKGTTAYVSTLSASRPPQKADYTPGNVIADETGVVEKITVLDGVAKVHEGETVEKGSVLISGAVESERIETMLRHGRGRVIARVWREKTVNIPKKTEIRHRTDEVHKVRAVKIKKFIVNFSLNSRFLYPKYDRIRNSYKLGSFPVEFISDSYIRVETSVSETDVEAEEKRITDEFCKEITDGGAQIVSVDAEKIDEGESMRLRVTAECLRDIAVEVPM